MARRVSIEVAVDPALAQRGFRSVSRSASQFNSDITKASRGALAGSGAFRAMGRSLAFASAAFIGTAGFTAALKSSIDAAETNAKANAALATALSKVGTNAKAALPSINDWALQQAKFGVSANTALTGLGRLVELTGSAKTAMAGYSAALVISKATGKDFNAVSLAVGKALNGQTTALARYIGKLPKGISNTELLARVSAKYGGQAEANTVATDRLRAELANTEVVIGNALLPTVEKFATKLSDWLSKTQNQQRIQRDLSKALEEASVVIGGLSKTVQVVDKVTGGFQNTVEALLALKVGFIVAGWAKSLGAFAAAEAGAATVTVAANSEVVASNTAVAVSWEAVQGAMVASVGTSALASSGIAATGATAATSAVKVTALSTALRRFGLIGAVTAVIEIAIHRKSLDDFEQKVGSAFTRAQQGGFTDALAKTEAKIANIVPGVHVDWHSLTKAIDDQTRRDPPVLTPTFSVNPKIMDVTDKTAAQMFPAGLKAALTQALSDAGDGVVTSTGHSRAGLTASQKNTFFDNAIARVLLRGGLGGIAQQIAGLRKADSLIRDRLAVTKDVTRRLNLEDQLLQNSGQLKSLRQQLGQTFLSALQFGVTKAQATASLSDDLVALRALQSGIEKRIKIEGRTLDLQQQEFDVQQQIIQARKDQQQARIDVLASKQFKQLGLSSAGEDITPGVKTLKKRLSQLTASVSASSLNTPKLQSELARFRKVLSEGLVPRDVRAKIRDLMDQISQELKGAQTGHRGKFLHFNSALLTGLGLSPEQVRALRERLAQVGPGGTVPGRHSPAFAGAGGNNQTVVHTNVNVDGRTIAKVVSKHQDGRRTPSRRN